MLNECRVNIKKIQRVRIYKGKPDFIPVISVFFLLLIFFVLSSSFVQVSGIKVELPEISSGSSLGIEKFVVTIDSEDKIYFNDKQVSGWNALKEELLRLASRSNAGTIILRADKKTPFGTVAKLMSLAEEVNLNVFIATVAPGKENEQVFKDNEGK